MKHILMRKIFHFINLENLEKCQGFYAWFRTWKKKKKKGGKRPNFALIPPPKCEIFFKWDLPLVHNTIYIQALWELLASWIIGLSDLKHYKSSIVCNNGYWTTSDQGLSNDLNFKKSKNIGNSVWTNNSNIRTIGTYPEL